MRPWTDPKSILVAVDFSLSSAAAYKQALRIAHWSVPAASIHVLHVVEEPIAPPIDFPLVPASAGVSFPSIAELESEARRNWTTFLYQCKGPPGTHPHIEVGSPRDRILESVRRERPDLVVVGACGASAPRPPGSGIGPVAAACAQRAGACGGVLIVPEECRGPFRSIVACIDFSETSLLVAEAAVEIANRENADLHFLHVYLDPWHGLGPPHRILENMPDFAQQFRHAVEARLRSFCEPAACNASVARIDYKGLEAPTHGEGIIAFARQFGCHLAIVGTRGKWNMRDFFWGSTAERVVRHAPCAVLAIKPPGFIELQVSRAEAEEAALIDYATH